MTTTLTAMPMKMTTSDALLRENFMDTNLSQESGTVHGVST